MTIYLALVLVLVTGLILVITESARVQAVNSKLKGITYMAADSCFASYAREIFDDYGIMALFRTEEEFTEDLEDYIEKNINISDLDMDQGSDFYLMDFTESTVSDIEHITDNSGMVFEEQVVEYMRYHLVSDAVEKVLSSLLDFEQGSKISAFLNKISEYAPVFTSVISSVSSIQTAVDKIKSIVSNPKTILETLRQRALNYVNNNNIWDQSIFNEEVYSLKRTQVSLKSYFETVVTETENYLKNSDEAKNALEDLEKTLEESMDVLEEENLKTLSEELDELRKASGNMDEDYYNVLSNYENAKEKLSKLESIDDLLYALNEPMDSENAEYYLSLVTGYSSAFSGFNADDLEIFYEEEQVEKRSPGFLGTVNSLIQNGLLGTVTDKEISNSAITLSNLPSITCTKNASDTEESLLKATERKILMAEYVLEHFGNFANVKDDTALDYEAEYILCGNQCDRDNLSGVVSRLVALRGGLNLISFLMDSEKKAEAKALAVSIVGFTGNETLVSVAKALIIGLWCAAEGICDVRTLLDGGKVKVIKSADEWTMTLTKFTGISLKSIVSNPASDGLEYEDYLRILLLLQNSETQAYRTMDMIQANMCKNKNSSFRMEECITSVNITAEYECGPLFAMVDLASLLIGDGSRKYHFKIEQQYSY